MGHSCSVHEARSSQTYSLISKDFAKKTQQKLIHQQFEKADFKISLVSADFPSTSLGFKSSLVILDSESH
jgi:hypothetical protein